jgi:PKHD-type hydroxylase
MAFQATWYFSQMPEKIVDIVEEDLQKYENEMKKSLVGSGQIDSELNSSIRNSDNTWIPDDHWLGGFLWHYAKKANQENFLYDIDTIDGNSVQFTRYSEGEFYGWHVDEGVLALKRVGVYNKKNTNPEELKQNLLCTSQHVRKLSISLLLSNPEDFEGGNLEFIGENGGRFIAPRVRGSVTIFDSRMKHRVQPVTKGVRKSIVAWIVGPRWK